MTDQCKRDRDEITKAEMLARALNNVMSGGRSFDRQPAAQCRDELRRLDRIAAARVALTPGPDQWRGRMSLRFEQLYEGGRIVLCSGQMQVGAVFPMPNGEADWRMFIGRFPNSGMTGSAKSVLAAKNQLTAAWADWLARAGLRQGSEVEA